MTYKSPDLPVGGFFNCHCQEQSDVAIRIPFLERERIPTSDYGLLGTTWF